MGNIYKYLCWISPVLSNKVNIYTFILYNFDSINILSESMKNWGCYINDVRLYYTISFYYQTRDLIKITYVSKWVTQSTKEKNHKHNFIFKMVTPGLHWVNNIKQKIQTFNDHSVLGMCKSDTKFTLKLWDHVLPQAKITLNIPLLYCLHHQLFDQLKIVM